ncbi:MAG: hypothetical protein M1478_04530 [Deltaproteobacteria bacterium]|jgi:hypothetical protein|nr:hypothetical protein [Deltaproteobacteria bacterium]MCL5880081.1 hypothetical protein [Deltaproteobacteria bacterium]
METAQNSQIKFTNKIKTPFTWVENDLIRSKSLSAEELGLYIILRSFGENIYPSVDYLVDLTKIGKKKLYFDLNQLIAAKLLLRKQTKKGKVFSSVEYRILSLNDNYEEIYKEFIGEEPLNPQTLDNSQSRSCGHLRHAQIRHALNDHHNKNNVKDKEESLKEKEPHTQKEEVVCEDEISKIKKTKIFQNSDPGQIRNLIKNNGKKAVIAAEYIEKAFSGQTIRNPVGLLIRTLERGSYSEFPHGNNINGFKADLQGLNEKYKGFLVFKGERIKEILNIGGRIAFYTDNCLREIVYTPAKSHNEFESYLKNKQEANNTS